MRIPRIYHPTSLNSLTSCTLSEDGANHVGRVLRMQPGDQLELFDGSNHIYQAVINAVTKKSVDVDILSRQLDDRESPLAIHLGQVISRGERMEFTIQKSVELGVECYYASVVRTLRCEIRWRTHGEKNSTMAKNCHCCL